MRSAWNVRDAACRPAIFSRCEEKNNPVAGAKDAVKDAGKAVGDTTTKAVDATKDAVKTGVDKTQEWAAAATTWVSDTYDKQWPSLKSELDGYASKAAEITDIDAKAKAQALVDDLKAQVPKIEQNVADLKNATGAELQSLLDSSKRAWDAFSAKMSELKSMITG